MNQRSTKIVQLLSKEKDEITVSGFAEYFSGITKDHSQ